MPLFTHQDLRRFPTYCERIIWSYLRARRMLGLKFRRQHPLGPYIVDFICLREKIIIEIDGLVHKNQKAYDRKRDEWIGSKGYTVLRINNVDLEKDKEGFIEKLKGDLMRSAKF